MSKSKLTQEELVEELESWYGLSKFHAHPVLKEHHEQAFAQLKEIVKNWYKFNLWDLKVGVIDD